MEALSLWKASEIMGDESKRLYTAQELANHRLVR